MTLSRRLTLAFAAARGGFGLGLVVAPARLASGWLGDEAERPRAQVALRGLGARDIALAGGAAAAALAGAPLEPWLVANIACDLSDIGASLAAGSSLPQRAVPGTIALAGVSILAGAALLAARRSASSRWLRSLS
jgi:hypothetical protein